jgi:acetyl esterase/lipase
LPPYAVPARREDLSGLPETWIGIGDVDLFYAESRQYEARLKEAGVNCEFSVVEGGPHAFELFVQKAPVVQEFIASYYQFLRRVLGL